MGRYTEPFFPTHNVRFIAINDGVDSSRGDNDFTLFRNLFNDFYAKDTSKKIRAVLRNRGTSGQHIGKPPYGYMEDPARSGYWLVDPEAGPFVKHIFDLAVAGLSPSRIACRLEDEKVLTSRNFYVQKKGKPLPAKPYAWHESSIEGILDRPEYNGCTCNFKSYSKSYKLKKQLPNVKDDMHIVEDTREVIVPMAQWQRVQELRKNKRRLAKADHQGLFSRLLCCADCGNRLAFATCTTQKKSYDHYVCSHYRRPGGCRTRYIREEVLAQIVLERIRAVNEFVRTDVEGFEEEWLHCSQKERERAIRENEKHMAQIRRRLDDIDTLQSRIYEDSVLGNLPRERWKKMSQDYKGEQERLKLELEILEENVEQFRPLATKYLDAPERIDGVRTKRFRFVLMQRKP